MVDGRARGIVCRNLITGEIESYAATQSAWRQVATPRFFTSRPMRSLQCHRRLALLQEGRVLRQPLLYADSSDLPARWAGQSKLTLMSESLRNDGRVWVPKMKGETVHPRQIPEADRDYFLERLYPTFGNLVPRDIASRAAKAVCDEGHGVGPDGRGVYLDFATPSTVGEDVSTSDTATSSTCTRITGEDPYRQPMRIYPAPHYTMGGLWVDYNLMTTIPGLYVLGEANFTDHGANRSGQRPHAGSGRRLLHHSVTHRRLPGARSSRKNDDGPSRVRRERAAS